jgi:winged helix-turn helix protein
MRSGIFGSRRALLPFGSQTNLRKRWLIPVLAEADSQGGFPNRAEFDSTMANKRRLAMAAAVGLRGDYSAGALRAAAKRSKDGAQTRRLLALAAIYDGARRTEAAKIGGVTLQVVRDWVVRFNAQGPDGLIGRKAPGQRPRLSTRRIARRSRRSSRAGRSLRFMGSCVGGSSIFGNGFSRNSASSSPSRHSAACCARWAIASFRLAPAITPRPRMRSRILKKPSRAPGRDRAREGR